MAYKKIELVSFLEELDRKFLENPKKVADRENFCKKKKSQKRLR